ncbi:hypothetical protein [Stenotrophomonas ginsengisoli]|uniref:hypothetical protein n=1 Tax=Stenotrophomonas ginsengisoli TaxID=336566 RepID=UPI00128EEA25|nr:hypothetical protein [Stenotrophomonas ginsengisoli]
MQSFLGRGITGKGGYEGLRQRQQRCVKILAHKWFVNMTAAGLGCKTSGMAGGRLALALLADEWQVHRFDLQGKLTG